LTWSSGATGKLISTTDARGTQTVLTYGSVGGFDIYPTQIQTAYGTSVQRTETRVYDFYTGLVTRVTDVDNNVSTFTDYDPFGRPTLVKAAEGKPEETRTVTIYSDVDRRVIVKADMNTLGDGKLVSIQHYDQLGRVRLSRQLEDSVTQNPENELAGIKVQTRYRFSGSNSYQVSSHPYREAYSWQATGTMDWTRSKSDNGGRLIEVQNQKIGSGLRFCDSHPLKTTTRVEHSNAIFLTACVKVFVSNSPRWSWEWLAKSVLTTQMVRSSIRVPWPGKRVLKSRVVCIT
jgi:hypothetical protein